MLLSRRSNPKALFRRVQVPASAFYSWSSSRGHTITNGQLSSGSSCVNKSTLRKEDAVQLTVGIMRSSNAVTFSRRMSSSKSTARPKILIFGTGSIGTVYAFILSRAGCHITAVCRSNYDAVKAEGFTLDSTTWGTHTFQPDAVVRSVNDVPDTVSSGSSSLIYDYILVTAKSFPGSKPTQASLIASAVKEGHTTIALLQNGIDIESEYSQLYPENPLLSCVVYLPATQTSPAHVQHKEVEHVHVGTYPSGAASSHKRAAEQLVDLMKTGGATATLHNVSNLPSYMCCRVCRSRATYQH